ncbi:MAG: cytochrome c oxidase subunit II [Candidatus Eisenbacteria bacterium]|nr:cytochrome c oxidase subunit II [Candidatus Eisenbacteria bacterium]
MNLILGFLRGAGRLVDDGSSFWMPSQASTAAPGVDRLFYIVFWISVFFFALIVVLGTIFVLRYRRRSATEKAAKAATHNTPLEVTWTVVPLLIVFVLFALGFKGFLDMSVAPADAYEVQVTAQRWKWIFTYPNGLVDENLHVPVNVPVRLVMVSEDVIHSFFVPEFRMKRDVVPGRYNKAWFRATKPGEYQLFCAEYCGTSHSDMLASVIVHEPGGFEKWLESAATELANASPAEAGARLYRSRGCAQCHSVDGKGMVGPTFRGLYGHEVVLKDGTRVVVDENYVRESILSPQAKVVAGFDPVMPTYQGRLKDQEITAIIAYLKTLQDAGAPGGQ